MHVQPRTVLYLSQHMKWLWKRLTNMSWMSSKSTNFGDYTDDFQCTLESVLGVGGVSRGEAVRGHHGHDESHHPPQPPDAVVFPSCLEQVRAVARLCNEFRVPLIPFGTGTGLEGGVVATKGGVCMDMCKMDSIVEVSREDLYATVEPGVTRLMLNKHLRNSGLMFPVDPGADASLCGMVATRASGTNAVKYGTMRENVLNLQVVLADGSVVHTAGLKGRARKSSAGYNLTQLFVGSEGTLGVITQATVRLHAIPETTVAALCTFPSIRAAVDATVHMLAVGVSVGRVELLDEISIDVSNQCSNLDLPVSPTLFMEFSGTSAAVEEDSHRAKELVEENGCVQFTCEREQEAKNTIWRARHEWLYAGQAQLSIGRDCLTTDVCVPISKLPQVVTETREDLNSSGLIKAPIFGHVGDGNFHAVISYNKDEQQTADEVVVRMARRAMRVGGTCTGEHGVGLGKRGLLMEEFGGTGVELMKQIKGTLDPNGIMNPGKLFM
ncbi:probable D-lactate dehydrogenase, mitochondrial [Halichondria panicea]|uniref:probable D-lactate dehydrogenase, mitochondrial n=1 Tax=Halichondria panicea TaxID=6063 RepID=UPI00312B72C1